MKKQPCDKKVLFVKAFAVAGIIHFGLALLVWAFVTSSYVRDSFYGIDWIMLLLHALPACVLLALFTAAYLVSRKRVRLSVRLLAVSLASSLLLFVIETRNDLYQFSTPILGSPSLITTGYRYIFNNWWWYHQKVPFFENAGDSFLYGFINKEGIYVIAPQYEQARSFSDGYAAILKEGRWGFIDKTGQEVIPCLFEDARSFSEGLAAVANDGEWFYIDAQGRRVIPDSFANTYSFSEGLAPVLIEDRWGYIDPEGHPVIEPKFEDAGEFREGLAAARHQGLWGYIDQAGSFVIAPSFTSARCFSEGLAAVEANDRWGYINRQGGFEIAPRFDYVSSFRDGLACVICIGKQWGYRRADSRYYIDCKGEIVKTYDGASGFSEGLFAVRYADRYGFTDAEGHWVIEPRFDSAHGFSEELSLVGIRR